MKKLKSIFGFVLVAGAVINETVLPFLKDFVTSENAQAGIKVIGLILAYLSKSPIGLLKESVSLPKALVNDNTNPQKPDDRRR